MGRGEVEATPLSFLDKGGTSDSFPQEKRGFSWPLFSSSFLPGGQFFVACWEKVDLFHFFLPRDFSGVSTMMMKMFLTESSKEAKSA